MIKFIVWTCCGPEETTAPSADKARCNVAYRLRRRGVYVSSWEASGWIVRKAS